MQSSSNLLFPSALPKLDGIKPISSYLNNGEVKYPQSFILNFLSPLEWLTYRVSCMSALNETKKMVGPYSTYIEFVIATTGIFLKVGKEKELDFLTGSGMYSEKENELEKALQRLNDGWTSYNTTYQNAHDMNPAILYKIRKLNVDYRLFTDYEAMALNGRIYSPGSYDESKNWIPRHQIDVNYVWLLAQIHIGRSFELLSDLDFSYGKREEHNEPSAFAREITGAYAAKYRYSHFSLLGGAKINFLMPTVSKKEACRLTIRDISLSERRIFSIFKEVCESKKQKDNPLNNIHVIQKKSKKRKIDLVQSAFGTLKSLK